MLLWMGAKSYNVLLFIWLDNRNKAFVSLGGHIMLTQSSLSSMHNEVHLITR